MDSGYEDGRTEVRNKLSLLYNNFGLDVCGMFLDSRADVQDTLVIYNTIRFLVKKVHELKLVHPIYTDTPISSRNFLECAFASSEE